MTKEFTKRLVEIKKSFEENLIQKESLLEFGALPKYKKMFDKELLKYVKTLKPGTPERAKVLLELSYRRLIPSGAAFEFKVKDPLQEEEKQEEVEKEKKEEEKEVETGNGEEKEVEKDNGKEEKEYLGSKESDQYYYVNFYYGVEGNIINMVLVDAEGEELLNAEKEDMDVEDPLSFILEAINKEGITLISYDIIEKYILEEEKKEEEEEVEEEEEEEEEPAIESPEEVIEEPQIPTEEEI